MDQQQNGQRQKGPQQNARHQSGCAKKTCLHEFEQGWYGLIQCTRHGRLLAA